MPGMASADQMSVDGRCLFRIHASVVIRDAAGRVLLVQEEKEGSRGKWNLPGGHVDHGENPVQSALREALEESQLTCRAKALVGIYPRHKAVRFVVLCDDWEGTAMAGDQILAVRWMSIDEALAMPAEQIVGNTATVLRDVAAGRWHELTVVSEVG